jgi:tRNA-intron endonuclease
MEFLPSKTLIIKHHIDDIMPRKQTVTAVFSKQRVLCEDTGAARGLYDNSRYGSISAEKQVELGLIESLYLMEKGRVIVLDYRKKEMTKEQFMKRAIRQEPKFWIRFAVFKDLRNRGYIVKTALKFGADFRVYDRGIKPGEDHAKWVVFPVHESSTLTWHEFSAKNRVAHSTKKKLLLAIVDDEGDVSYWEAGWVKP